jgi:hypothetical protein
VASAQARAGCNPVRVRVKPEVKVVVAVVKAPVVNVDHVHR